MALAGDVVDSIVCDPPYDLKFMGKVWDGTAVAFDPETWRAAFEVLKPGGYLVAFGGTRTYHRMAVAIEDAGFEIRDCLMWIYATGFPKSHDVSKAIDKAAGAERDRYARPAFGGTTYGTAISDVPATPEAAAWSGWGTALKPAVEPIVLARKPLVGTVAANVLAHGVGGLNIDGCRIGTVTRTNASAPRAERTGFIKGFVDGTASVTHDYGRWPANVLHDGSPEVVALFPTCKDGGGKDSRGNPSQVFSMDTPRKAKRTDSHAGYGNTVGSAARFFYCAKASKADRAGSKHPTVKPLALMRWLCRLVTPPGGRILDPFAGSGTTLAAAYHEGFAAVGCEMEPEYIADIERRLTALDAADELALFA